MPFNRKDKVEKLNKNGEGLLERAAKFRGKTLDLPFVWIDFEKKCAGYLRKTVKAFKKFTKDYEKVNDSAFNIEIKHQKFQEYLAKVRVPLNECKKDVNNVLEFFSKHEKYYISPNKKEFCKAQLRIINSMEDVIASVTQNNFKRTHLSSKDPGKCSPKKISALWQSSNCRVTRFFEDREVQGPSILNDGSILPYDANQVTKEVEQCDLVVADVQAASQYPDVFADAMTLCGIQSPHPARHKVIAPPSKETSSSEEGCCMKLFSRRKHMSEGYSPLNVERTPLVAPGKHFYWSKK